MADFFNTSVDVLIGYEWSGSSAAETLSVLKRFRLEKQYSQGADAARKALRNYPNHFVIVYESAQLFYEKAALEQNRSDYEAALKQLERACELLAQNTDKSIRELCIRNQMAQIHFALGHTDTCLELLKHFNSCGINNAQIGCILADCYHQTDDAQKYLTEAFGKLLADLDSIVIGFTTVFWMERDFASILSSINWLRTLLRGPNPCNGAIWFDKYDCVLMAIEAEVSLMLNNPAAAKDILIHAAQLALRFDRSDCIQEPPLLKKLGAQQNHYMNYGVTALEATERRVLTDAEIVPQLPLIWRQVKAEVLQP